MLIFLLWSATVCVDYYDTWSRFRSRGISVQTGIFERLSRLFYLLRKIDKRVVVSAKWTDRQTCVVSTLFVLLRSSCMCMKICFALRHRWCMLWWLHKRKAASKRTSWWCSHSFRSCSLAWNSTRAWSKKNLETLISRVVWILEGLILLENQLSMSIDAKIDNHPVHHPKNLIKFAAENDLHLYKTYNTLRNPRHSHETLHHLRSSFTKFTLWRDFKWLVKHNKRRNLILLPCAVWTWIRRRPVLSSGWQKSSRSIEILL